MRQLIRTQYRLTDKGPLRALSLILSLLLAGCLFWDPSRYAAQSSNLAVWQGFLGIWAVCTGVIHGVGFRPRQIRWQALFLPLPALLILLVGIYWFYS
ncbi:cyd operon protein YbgE [Mixta mediterraneensis]|uniref:cyd operon protein YbgE n=1 Tax=Mixta mediterraneensis TaxID=2758443 RepID=UPI00187485D0|nr:cyd operon protein YbgE [Mixta mediterraneensis]MBE5252606.1 cyd operon protein YbgE [Mixta mediterraneensis]